MELVSTLFGKRSQRLCSKETSMCVRSRSSYLIVEASVENLTDVMTPNDANQLLHSGELA